MKHLKPGLIFTDTIVMFSNIDLLLINNHKLERLKTQTLERKSYIFNIKSVFSHMDTFDKALIIPYDSKRANNG